jgi:uncharacterized protein (DUF1778 family)
MTTERRKVGRPRKPPERALTERFDLRLSPLQMAEVLAAASISKRPLREFVRRAAVDAARAILAGMQHDRAGA